MPRPKPEDDRIRLNLSVTPTVKERLDRLQKMSEAESLTEVVRRALAAYEELLDTVQNGGQLLLRERGGKTTELRLVV